MIFIHLTTRVRYLTCPRCPSQILPLGPAYSARPMHHSAPDRTARAAYVIGPAYFAHRTQSKGNQLLFTCKLFLSVPSHLKIKDFISSKCHQYGLTIFFVEFSVGLLNISWPKMDLQIMRYLHIKEQDQKSNIWPM